MNSHLYFNFLVLLNFHTADCRFMQLRLFLCEGKLHVIGSGP